GLDQRVRAGRLRRLSAWGCISASGKWRKAKRSCRPRRRPLASRRRLPHSQGRTDVLAVSPMSIQSINPATGQVLETFNETTPAEVERALTRAHSAFGAWRDVPFA